RTVVLVMSTELQSFDEVLGRSVSLIHGELIERSRIVDALLDVRTTTSASSLVEVIDAALRSLPGRTTVRSSWWQGILDELNLAAELELHPSQRCRALAALVRAERAGPTAHWQIETRTGSHLRLR